MSTILNLLKLHLSGIAAAFVVIFIAAIMWTAYELRRRQKIRHAFRNSCDNCGSKNVERRYIRVPLPADTLNPFLVQKGDFVCQAQKKCHEELCPRFDKWMEEKTVIRHFNLIRQIFRPSHCKAQGDPKDILGPMRKRVVKKNAIKSDEVKHSEILPSPILMPTPSGIHRN